MGMFNWTPGPDRHISSPYLYVYFVVTLPLTLLVYAAWFWWFKVNQKVRKLMGKTLPGQPRLLSRNQRAFSGPEHYQRL